MPRGGESSSPSSARRALSSHLLLLPVESATGVRECTPPRGLVLCLVLLFPVTPHTVIPHAFFLQPRNSAGSRAENSCNSSSYATDALRSYICGGYPAGRRQAAPPSVPPAVARPWPRPCGVAAPPPAAAAPGLCPTRVGLRPSAAPPPALRACPSAQLWAMTAVVCISVICGRSARAARSPACGPPMPSRHAPASSVPARSPRPHGPKAYSGRHRTSGSPPRPPGACWRLRPPRAAAHAVCARARSLSASFSRVSVISARSPRSPGSEGYPGCHLTPGRAPRPRGLSWSRPPPGAASLRVRV